jgi:hypothetical protein
VKDFRTLSLYQSTYLSIHFAIPDRVGKHGKRVSALQLVVVRLVDNNLLPMLAKEIGFQGKDLIFAPGLLIRVVDQKDPHSEPFLQPAR